MTINRTTLLDLPLPVTGTESGTWGDIVNNGLSEYIDISVAGSLSLSADSDTNLSSTEGNAAGTNIGSTTAQYAILRCTGARTATRNINAPAWAISGGTLTNYSKIYIVVNETTGSQNIVLRATNSATPTYTTGVTIVPGERAVCAWNGSDFVKVGGAAGGSTTQIQFNNAGVFGGSANLTWDGTNVQIGATGALRLADTDSSNYVAFKSPGTVASNVTWTLPSADGTNGQALTTNGSGTLAFSSVTTSPGGSTTQVQYNNAGAFGGSANFVFDGTNVGIGTSSPATKLDVRGTPGADYGIANIFDTTSAASGVGGVLALSGYKTTTSGAAIFAKIKGIKENATAGNEAGALTFETNSGSAYTERMRIDSSGNVGIGTSSPSQELEVRKDQGSGTLVKVTNKTNNNSAVAGVLFENSTSNNASLALWDSGTIAGTVYSDSYGFYLVHSGGPIGIVADNASGVIKFATGGTTERMRITSAGLVGIGTSTPNTFTFNNLVVASGSANAGMAIYGTGQTTLAFATATSGSDSYRGYIQYTSGGTDAMTFGTASTERMRINTSGNVGIGTSSPSYRFDVSGASASGIARFANAWGDGTNPAILVDGTGSDGRLVQIKSGGTRSWPLLWVTASTTDVLVVNGDSTIKTAGTISVGGATPSTSGAGITFPATQSASSDANTLDDYEEGTWTPVLASFTGTGGRTLTGTYTKIGRLVYITVKISDGTQTLESTGNTSNITGLPFTVSGVTAFAGITTNYFDTTNQGCGIYFNTTVIYTVTFSIAASRTIVISGTYEV